jgi:hypothetical protein
VWIAPQLCKLKNIICCHFASFRCALVWIKEYHVAFPWPGLSELANMNHQTFWKTSLKDFIGKLEATFCVVVFDHRKIINVKNLIQNRRNKNLSPKALHNIAKKNKFFFNR